MAEQFYTILTNVGKAKVANSLPTGTKVNLTKLKIGDSNGTYYNPSETQTDLVHKVYECNVTSVEVDEENPSWVTITSAIPSDVGGFMIREVGVFDDGNNLIAIGKYPETYKPVASDGSTKELYIKMTLEITNSSSVELKIDPTVIIATKKDIQILDNSISSINAQLSEITQFKLIADIDGTNYKSGDAIDYGYIRTRQEYLYGLFYRKLLTGLVAQICCMGDSLTNGQDTTSGDTRVATADITRVSGETHSGQTIASTTYPEALQSNLQSVYGSQVKVINRGYSGDWVKNGYTNYPNKHDSDITVIMYGTNDPRAPWVPDDIRGNLEQYILWYEQLIIREILWDKAVIILTPPKLQTASDVNIETFTIALNALGEKYGIPVIDSTEFTANYPSTIYSDSVHFNGDGYKVFASKVTALFIGEGAKKPMLINDGETLLTRPNIDNLQYFGGAVFSNTGGAVETPAEAMTTEGITGTWTGTSKGIIYSFYTEENDIMVLPFYYSSNGNLRVTLDFNTSQAQNMNDLLVDSVVSLTEVLTKQVVYTTPTTPGMVDLIKATGDTTQPTLIRISEKGWHTLMIDTTDSNTSIVFNSVHFMNYRNYKQQKDILLNQNNISTLQSKNINKVLHKLTHSTYSSSPASVSSIDVTFLELNSFFTGNLLNVNEYYRSIPLKVVLYNVDTNIIEYGFMWNVNGTGTVPTAGFYAWSIKQTDLIASPTNYRTITSITLDTINKKFVVNFGGNLNQLGSVLIQPI